MIYLLKSRVCEEIYLEFYMRFIYYLIYYLIFNLLWVYTHGYSFYTWNYNAIICIISLYSFAYIVPLLAIGRFSGDSYIFAITHGGMCFVFVCFSTLSYILALRYGPGSSFILPARVLESTISPRSLCSFIEEWIRNHDRGVSVCGYTFVSLPCQLRAQKQWHCLGNKHGTQIVISNTIHIATCA